MKPIYFGRPWDKYKCPDYRGVLISEKNLYYKTQFGTFLSVLNTGVSSIEGFHRNYLLLKLFDLFPLIYYRIITSSLINVDEDEECDKIEVNNVLRGQIFVIYANKFHTLVYCLTNRYCK